ncbi:MAG: HDIG domain-containing protein [Bacteroidales bacterium]|jgi:uncharacterized protein|nr:HDIG domain-containing protein [Bacteroidales bacterium]
MKSYWTVIDKYFLEGSKARDYYILHVESVAKMALKICDEKPQLHANRSLIETAVMLHDVGICKVNAPEIGCYGDAPYIQHGILGAEIVKKEGFHSIVTFCENHIGIGGFSKEYIAEYHLPLPHRDMIPITIEEKIVAFSDKFFSKSKKALTIPKSIEEIRQDLIKYGAEKVALFDEWSRMFIE